MALSSATQDTMHAEFGRKWGTEHLNTRYNNNLIFDTDPMQNSITDPVQLPDVTSHRGYNRLRNRMALSTRHSSADVVAALASHAL